MIRMFVQEGDAARSTHVLDRRSIRIGREASNDVVVRDRYVSSRHGELRVGAEGLVYEDFATTNGSRVRRGGQVLPVDAGTGYTVTLQEGDELLLGDKRNPVRVRFELAAAKVFSSRGVVSPPSSALAAEIDAVHGQTLCVTPKGFDREVLLALHGLTSRLQAQLDRDGILAAFADGTLEAFPRANHVAVWLVGDDGREFRPVLSRGRQGDTDVRPVSRTVRDSVIAQGKAVAFNDSDTGFDLAESLHDSRVRAGLCAPLWDGRRITGLVQVDCRGLAMSAGFGSRELEILAVFAHQAAMALENARLHENLRKSVEQAITALGAALEAKDTYTKGHGEAVAALAAATCLRMGMSRADARAVTRAALLHDLGKIAIPYEILNKTGPLTPEEFAVLRTHPEVGARILAPFDFLQDVVAIVRHHHERWDGAGYPDRLAGERIPLGARIVAACDTWHSLVHDRAYRKALPSRVAADELRRAAGSQLDPAVVDALLSVASERDHEDARECVEA